MNPFYWLASRERLALAVAWAVVGVLFLVWLGFLGVSFATAGTKREVCFAVAVFTAYGAFVFWKSFVAIEAARRVAEDRQSGTLELVLVTPLSVGQMLEGHRRALIRIFLGPGLVVVFVNVAMLGWLASLNPTSEGHEWVVISGFLFAIGGLLLTADLLALGYTGMWVGLRTQRFRRALLAMLGRVMLVPWLGIGFFALVLISGAGLSAENMFFLLFAWVLLSLIVDAAISVESRDRLSKEFRRAASGDRGH